MVVSMVELAEDTRLPSWYDVPTTKVLKEPGDSSIRWMGMTPHAPCTQNCSKNAAAIIFLLPMKVYGYNSAPPITEIKIMLKRRPKIWEEYPTIVPPVMAPRFATTCVTVTASGEKLY